MIAAIACIDDNNGIGYQGELLERIPEDMKRFKEIVTNKAVFVGRTTWDTLPKEKINERNFVRVISNKYEDSYYHNLEENVIYMHLDKLSQVIEAENEVYQCDMIVIGGASIYKQLFSHCDTLYITHIHKEYKFVDTYFPIINPEEWECIESSELKEHNNIIYNFETYKRI